MNNVIKPKKCQDANNTLEQFRKIDLEKMRNEFKNRYNMSIDEKKTTNRIRIDEI